MTMPAKSQLWSVHAPSLVSSSELGHEVNQEKIPFLVQNSPRRLRRSASISSGRRVLYVLSFLYHKELLEFVNCN